MDEIQEVNVMFLCVQEDEEIYIDKSGKTIYIRQPYSLNNKWYSQRVRDNSTFWSIAERYNSKYIPKCLVNEDTRINVLDGKRVAFSELCKRDCWGLGSIAQQTAPFRWEIATRLSEKVRSEKSLISNDDWLDETKNKKHKKCNMRLSVLLSKNVIKVLKVYDKKFLLVEERYVDKTNNVYWARYALYYYDNSYIEEICGYKYKN